VESKRYNSSSIVVAEQKSGMKVLFLHYFSPTEENARKHRISRNLCIGHRNFLEPFLRNFPPHFLPELFLGGLPLSASASFLHALGVGGFVVGAL
jgi:hypothetical protein